MLLLCVRNCFESIILFFLDHWRECSKFRPGHSYSGGPTQLQSCRYTGDVKPRPAKIIDFLRFMMILSLLHCSTTRGGCWSTCTIRIQCCRSSINAVSYSISMVLRSALMLSRQFEGVPKAIVLLALLPIPVLPSVSVCLCT